jgi:chromosome segregation protein
VHLKTLTLRGFKSFASATTLRFEPGVTCVVGPNGSGKSNVVDALAWVMGEQGAKSLRGGKMEDVIFAGTSGRPPLGRAEVTLTIDNSDGALPIDYSEVTISRILFRNGGSEYAINGNSCRLLDVQELLSDSGIGREMHVIVGQNQLDSVLAAGADERRGLIEEAAGVLKHRKRKEKALRKLDAMQANLTRLTDLTTELRRQLKPLGRQAEVARRAATIQADLRDARLRLLADDLVTLLRAFEQDAADEEAVRDRRAAIEREYALAQAREAEIERLAQALVPRLAAAQEAWYRLSSLRERLRGTGSVAAERYRNLSRPPEERVGRDPEELEAEAEAIREQEDALREDVFEAQQRLAEAVQQRSDAEAALAVEEKRLAAAVRSSADRREGLAKLAGRVDAARGRCAAGEAEIGRLSAAADEASARAASVDVEYQRLKGEVEGLDEGGQGLDTEVEEATLAHAAAEERLGELRAAERDAERERAGFAARKEALELGLNRKDGAGALLAATDQLSGLLGSVAAIVSIEQGAEAAIAAALGAAADAVAVTSVDTAINAMRLLKSQDAGRAALLVGGVDTSDTSPRETWPALPAGTRYAFDLVTAPAKIRISLCHLLHRVAVVDDLGAAAALVREYPGTSAVTREGDVVDSTVSRGGSSSAPTLLEVQAAVDEAADRLAEAERRCATLREQLDEAGQRRSHAKEALDELLTRRRATDARKANVAQQLGRLGGSARAAVAEVERYRKAIETAEESLRRESEALVELEAKLTAAHNEPDEGDPSTETRDELSAACTAARTAEMEARLATRTSEERMRALAGRADALDRAARQEREARSRLAARREQLSRGAAVAAAVVRGVEQTLRHLEVSLAAASTERDAAEKARAEREAELRLVRARVRELATELEKLTDSVHRDEVARAERRMRIEQLEAKSLEEFGVEASALIGEYGPDQPVPPVATPNGEVVGAPVPFDRAAQEKRLHEAERAYARLGKVNPLALEEFAAMEERHKFLTEQLEDLKATRRDLLTVIREVDERVERVFTEAFHDTAREFEGVFSRLFPGGDGRLVLTDPSDMLTTGIEIEARPPGKKVKRLSLLSGGERSLTAVALLVSIFKARPSPFYVMDEIEAALDDANLGRLITLIEELRGSSQLIVITHQKRTMEVADALYGVSMRGDGVTQVISQRLREHANA